MQNLRANVPPDPLDPERVPAEFKKEGDNILVVYNPEVSRALEVELMDTLYFGR